VPERVAVVGVRQVGYAPAIPDRTLEELIFEAASGALADAQVAWPELAAVVIGASDLVDGRVISSMVTAGPAGGYMKDLLAVASSAEHAFVLAWLRLAAGAGETALVAGWSKGSEAPVAQVEQLSLDPFYRRHLGLDGLVAAALEAGAYRDRYAVPEEAAARVVVKNRASGARNPHAERRQPVTIDEVLTSPVLAWPLRALETPPSSDGACALVLAREARARALRRPAAWVRGVGWASESYWREPAEVVEARALTTAAARAYRAAGVADPRREIAVAEVYDVTPYHELMACEGLGFCGPGEGGRLAADAGGGIAVNPSGGLLCANPAFAAGLVRVAEASLQVTGRAGDRQVAGARRAVAHGASGLGGQAHTVVVLDGEA
jgi:acetyl-CoA C-acetyltransferase